MGCRGGGLSASRGSVGVRCRGVGCWGVGGQPVRSGRYAATPQPGHPGRTATGSSSSRRPPADRNLRGGRTASAVRCSRSCWTRLRALPPRDPSGSVEGVAGPQGRDAGDAAHHRGPCSPTPAMGLNSVLTVSIVVVRLSAAPLVITASPFSSNQALVPNIRSVAIRLSPAPNRNARYQ